MSQIARAYAFAGSAFLTPDPARLFQLANELGDPQLVEAAGSDPEKLEPEYIRLFFNPAGSLCSLWQSAWSDDRRLMGEPHLRALEWFRRYDVEPSASNDPADHAGLLLLFYARLLACGAASEVRAAFVHDHLAWIPSLCERILAETAHPFYRLLAERTREWVSIGDPISDETEAPQ